MMKCAMFPTGRAECGPAAPLEKADENTLLVVLSDHGFGTFRRAFHTNTWLWQNGLLSLKDNRKPSEELGEGFAQVDWSKTYAYALGLGKGLPELQRPGAARNSARGRRGGARTPGNPEWLGEISRYGNTAHRDPQCVTQGRVILRGVRGDAPDLLVNFHPGFRALFKLPWAETPLERRSHCGSRSRAWHTLHESRGEARPCSNHRSRADDSEISWGSHARIHGRQLLTLKT